MTQILIESVPNEEGPSLEERVQALEDWKNSLTIVGLMRFLTAPPEVEP